ncbi:hypothetical protein [Treponema sp. R6D11]
MKYIYYRGYLRPADFSPVSMAFRAKMANNVKTIAFILKSGVKFTK